LGMDQAGRLLVVCHTFKETMRLQAQVASSRRAKRHGVNDATTGNKGYET
jgi:hypothetical protein